MKKFYNNTPGGCCGNDDCGQMSAWYVFSAMGFYPVNPASGVYVIGSPVVDKATIHLDPKYQKGGNSSRSSPKTTRRRTSTSNRPRSTASRFTRSWISHAELVAGGELVLKMGPKPNPDWGKRREDRPPATSF